MYSVKHALSLVAIAGLVYIAVAGASTRTAIAQVCEASSDSSGAPTQMVCTDPTGDTKTCDQSGLTCEPTRRSEPSDGSIAGDDFGLSGLFGNIMSGMLSKKRKPAKFAALAFSSENPAGTWGESWGYATATTAYRRSLALCRDGGGKNCRVRIWAREMCIGFAAGDAGAWGYAWHKTRDEAISDSLSHCSANGTNCSVRIVKCASDPTG